MTELENILHNIASQVSLTEVERHQIRGHLETLVSADQGTFSPVSQPSVWLDSLFFIRRHTLSVAFVALLFFTGTTGAIADRALPGDFLYPLKTNVNEEVLGWFSVSDYDKAELSIRIAERRLLEAESIENKEVDLRVKEDHRRLLESQVNDADIQATRFEKPQDVEKKDAEASSQIEKQSKTSESSQTTMMSSAPTIVDEGGAEQASFQNSNIYENNVQKREELRRIFKTLQKKVALLKKEKQFRETLIPTEAQLLKVQKMLLDVKKIKNDELMMETSADLLVNIENMLSDIEHTLISLENSVQGSSLNRKEENQDKEIPKPSERNNKDQEYKGDEVSSPGVL